ncbi:MAG: methionine ABC transporter permease [Nocardioides sp.]|uniref:methionine ABC transporter permease n=1 Tax=Nocardioides sp. TaxID=35761 RepID=UPI003F0EEC99
MSTVDTRLPELTDMLWTATLETLWIVALTLTLGGLLGLLLGLGLYATRPSGLYANRLVNGVLNLLVNFFRPIPFVIFIAAVQPLARQVVGIGIGNKAVVFALVLAAMFGISRLVEQNLVTVPPGVIEAARSMGASRLRILFTVVVPEAMGPLILGFTFGFVAIVDMSAIAGVIGGGGLGNFAQQYGYRQFDTVVTWTAVVVIVAIVQVGQMVGNTAARRVMRR